MNVHKSVLIKECNHLQIANIPVKTEATYLGDNICKDEKQRFHIHFYYKIEKIKKRFNLWLLRDLSLNGRVLLSKAEGISRSVYVSLSLDMPQTIKLFCMEKGHYLIKQL